ncbi:carbohydrate ABC transporter permease [Cytobacillus oceanisediminis]|uniref:Carbohydrate ABC transporter permease n=2 Tax=Niallia TaxID=2837506 RepID=A0A941JR98_NIACI|nr:MULTISPECIES: carbohydrate ABC transporter permease [Bacillaceae]EOR25340.1 binding-protein-dependent transport systems inner membrane component [Niallia nealsonii AAU1]MBQ6448169.1 carbohydrate ABC transporter permease [Bacillus sp. (in: firmicutes)]MDU1844265.1 carbohydrate ABC transporter permease [Niallia nealsonii]MBZ9533353.1 carbohydrate ABC transporter permease [Cytobacillus oceanisediminis]MCB5238132.1 carbohydrate ABC transporter permease [Niallia circulans]
MKESKQYKIFKVFNVCILLIIIFCTLYPFINVVAQSFSSESYINSGQVNLFPKGFNVETYQKVLSDTMFWINYKNTVVYTVVGTIISMFLTTIFAYALSKRRLVGRRFLTVFAVFTMFFNGGLIPNYVLINALGFANTMWAIVIPGAISIYNMLIMKSFFENMPEELEEAAAIDGLNTYGILLKIVLPLSKAVIATMVLFYAVAYWNSWFSAFIYLDKKELFPVTIYLRNMIAGTTSGMSAGATSADNLTQISANIKSVTMVLTILPILTVYPFVQKYFVSGVMLGSIK